MKRTISTGCFCFVVLLSTEFLLADTSVEEIVSDLSQSFSSHQDYSEFEIPENLRPEVYRSLRSMAESHPLVLKYNIILLRLGDRQTFDNLVRVFNESEDQNERSAALGALAYTNNPEIISKIANNLYQEDGDFTINGHVAQYSKSIATTALIIKLLANSDAFSQGTKQWAIGALRSPPITHKQALQRWWNSNRRYFQTSDFKSVRSPGEYRKSSDRTIPLQENESLTYNSQPQQTSVESSVHHHSDVKAKDVKISQTDSAPPPFNWFIVAIVCLLLVVAGLVGIKTIRRSS